MFTSHLLLVSSFILFANVKSCFWQNEKPSVVGHDELQSRVPKSKSRKREKQMTFKNINEFISVHKNSAPKIL